MHYSVSVAAHERTQTESRRMFYVAHLEKPCQAQGLGPVANNIALQRRSTPVMFLVFNMALFSAHQNRERIDTVLCCSLGESMSGAGSWVCGE